MICFRVQSYCPDAPRALHHFGKMLHIIGIIASRRVDGRRNFAPVMRKITEIIIHCSATPAGREVTVADIDRWHRQSGYRCIGYHYVVTLDGTVCEGRPVAEIGAHCKGHNAGSIGVCYVGGLAPDGRTPADTRTPAQRASLLALLRWLRRLYPGAAIRSHRDFAPKACPSFDATTEYASL